MKAIWVLVFLLIGTIPLSAQGDTDNWDVYMAQYDLGPGSTVLNLDLINRAPIANLPTLLVTGVTTPNCGEDGFPTSEELDVLYPIADEIIEELGRLTSSENVGSFTYQCERLEYFYIADSTGIREHLESLYQENYPQYKFYINIESDPDWKAYQEFLYPNEETLEFMANNKVLLQLSNAGDNLLQARMIDHFILFENETELKLFERWAKEQGYASASTTLDRSNDLPYTLHIARVDHVKPPEINNLTYSLRRKAEEMGGVYDGWETVVVR
ncbi:DUF695 domain-containing protein [Sanyastnella coralliicola]|uniref:DUF695 domain-containing protein n=1 Tax=Sanyastnella coralliicola TaxID=3069118 RepID=UPI0027B8AF5D|nr:DUF695 domain-containing protein [Longitalea sp. SCSIO 12813]